MHVPMFFLLLLLLFVFCFFLEGGGGGGGHFINTQMEVAVARGLKCDGQVAS